MSMSTLPKAFKLSNGQMIPALGFGTYKAEPGQVKRVVADAIRIGYTHLDCAWAYSNQDEVGEGIRESGIAREKLFVTSKLHNIHHHPDTVEPAIRQTLADLGLEYLDLFLMHWPLAAKAGPNEGSLPPQDFARDEQGNAMADYELCEDNLRTWRVMEDLQRKGLTRSIGVSNFNIHRLKTLMAKAEIQPVVNQVEINPGFPQFELVEFCRDVNVLPQAYSPLGAAGAKFRENKTIKDMAEKRGVDAANILISWCIARGCNPLPKSSTTSRIESNFQTVDLTPKEIETINAMARQNPQRGCDLSSKYKWDIFQDSHPEYNDKRQLELHRQQK